MGGRGCSVFEGALSGGIRDLFGDVFEGVYAPAMFIKMVRTQALNGDISQVAFGHDCFYHPLSQTQAYRNAAGLADKELEVIVLAKHLGEEKITTDDEIIGDDSQYTVVRAKLDGAKSQWRCVCVEKA